MSSPDHDVVYHGYRDHTGTALIEVQTLDGQILGTVRHVVLHSPDGLNWGYGGSGPADCARSLLIAALGDAAACPTCHGTARLVWDTVLDEDLPYDPARAASYDPTRVWECPDCDGGGYRDLPYQQFTRDHVAHFGPEWQIRRSQVLAWLATQPPLTTPGASD